MRREMAFNTRALATSGPEWWYPTRGAILPPVKFTLVSTFGRPSARPNERPSMTRSFGRIWSF